MKNSILVILLVCTATIGLGQSAEKFPRFFDNPLMSDSASTLMIPVRYNAGLFASNKISLGDDYYSNIIFYNFIADSTKRLFKDDTFIKAFPNGYDRYEGYVTLTNKNISTRWIFYFVKSVDYNESGRIDNDDPSILYVSDKKGNLLKAVTPANENVVSLQIFDKQGFALIKMQRDQNNDKNFEAKDIDVYFIKLDLKTLELGRKIETDKN